MLVEQYFGTIHAWHDGHSGDDGQAPGSTSTRRVLGARSHFGEKILRATLAFQGKREARY